MLRKATRALGGIVLSILLCGVSAASDSTAGVTSPTPLGHPPPAEGLEAWIDLQVIQKLAHHTSGVIAAVVLFSLVGFVVQRLMHDTWVKRCVLLIDELVLLGLFVFFAYRLFVFL
ncbi:MAG: hypothetical protein ACLQBA_15670 [Candidatus Binataceae bacterium]